MRSHFRIRVLLCTIFVVAAFFVFVIRTHQIHRAQTDREIAAVQTHRLDAVWESDCLLPNWIEGILPESIRWDFEHIVELDLQLNDLSYFTADDMSVYTVCSYVHTIRISNPTLKQDMFEAISSFPNLATIRVNPINWPEENHTVDLRLNPIPGVDVIVGERISR